MHPIELKINRTFVSYQKNEIQSQKAENLISNKESIKSIQDKNSYRLYELEKKIADIQKDLSREQIKESVLNKYIKYKTLDKKDMELFEDSIENTPKSIEKVLEIINSNKKILNNIIDKLQIEYENIFSIHSLSQANDISDKISYIETSKNTSYHNINVKRAKNLLNP